MSRIGKKVITLPEKVELNYNHDEHLIVVKGPLGELSRVLHSCTIVEIEGKVVNISVKNPDDKFERSIWGTTRAIIQNMIDGVSTGFSKNMELNGVGFKMELAADTLTLFIGFSHPVKVTVPGGIKLTLNKNQLSGTSINNEVLGNFFSSVHNMKICDPYKQKGFKFPDRFYRKKVVKKTK